MQPFARPYFIRRDKAGVNIKYPRAASQAYEPGALPAAYNWQNGVAVTPLTIVIGELGGKMYQSDLAPWAAHAGMPTPHVRTHLLPGADDSPGDADGEVMLDVFCAAQAWSYMTGMPADILVVYGPNSGQAFADVMNYANTQPNIGAGSWSWGSAEGQWATGELQALDAAANASKFPWTAASGDNGSNDGTSSPVTDAPSCSPFIVGCGGTSRVPMGGSETVWNNGQGEGTGGGFSRKYARPSWQPQNTQGNGRMVPDWAAVADPNTGYNTLVNGQWQVIGGTSAVAPLMAGFLAVINGARLKTGLPMIAQANPLLWGLASSFFDVASGNNGSYHATTGPDPCSGLGRALPALFAALSGIGQTPPTPPPTPVPTPPPQAAPYFVLNFPNVRKGQRVTFTAPTAIPAGPIGFVPMNAAHDEVTVQ